MNIKSITLVAGMAVYLFTACDAGHSHGEADHNHDSHDHHDHEHHDGHEHGDITGEIRLNNGEKWVVNEEMKPHVLKGEKLVDEYLSSGGADYKTLANQVEDANTNLISSCTMKGTSHDELHKWLHPHMELVAKLQQATDQANADQLIADIQASYEMYHAYFK